MDFWWNWLDIVCFCDILYLCLFVFVGKVFDNWICGGSGWTSMHSILYIRGRVFPDHLYFLFFSFCIFFFNFLHYPFFLPNYLNAFSSFLFESDLSPMSNNLPLSLTQLLIWLTSVAKRKVNKVTRLFFFLFFWCWNMLAKPLVNVFANGIRLWPNFALMRAGSLAAIGKDLNA